MCVKKSMEETQMKITIYNEYLHEKYDENIKAIYPDGIHGCIAKFLTEDGHE